MLAAPIVNPVTALSTLKAFSGQGAWLMTSSRLLLVYAVAVAVGLIVAKLPLAPVLRARVLRSVSATDHAAAASKPEEPGGCCGGHHDHNHHHHDHERSAAEGDGRLVAAARRAMRDFVDGGVYSTGRVPGPAALNAGIPPGRD